MITVLEAGRGGNGSVVITYLEPNDNPLFAPISSFSLNEDFGTFDINVTNNISDTEDADNLLNISYTMNTSSLFTISVSNITKVATFTSLPNTYGSREVNLTVFDTAGKKNTTTFMLTVNPVNDAPTFSAISSFSLTEDFSPYNIVASANISDNETADASLGISYTMNATGIFTIGVVNATSTITFTSLPNAYGSREVNLTVWDEDLSNTTTFTLTVNSVNDLPVFSSYYVNDTLLGNNQWARFNMSVNDTSDPAGGISSANGTINSINTSFTKDTADNWYYDFQCTASDTSVDFTAAWANDTDNAANTTVIGGIATECDAVPPQITLAKINATSTVITGTVVKVNASITDPETHLSSVWLSVEPPSAVHYNTTVTNSGSQYYNETIILTEVGKYIFRFYANDTLGQLNVSNATDLDNNQYIEAISAASAPVIYEITSILSQTITESSTTDVQFNVYAYDAQGVETMANSKRNERFPQH